MPTTLVVPTPIHSGEWDGAVWNEIVIPTMHRSPSVEAWWQFDLTSVGTQRVDSAVVTFESETAPSILFNLDLLIYNGPLLVNFSNTFTPTRVYLRTLPSQYTNRIFTGSGVMTLTLPLHNSIGIANDVIGAIRRITPGVSPRRFGLGLRITPNSPESDLARCRLTNLTLTVDQQFTGLSGPYTAMGRADECPRCGRKSTRDTWVADGYSKGLMVCPECYDEEDLVGRHYQGLGSERPGQGEG